MSPNLQHTLSNLELAPPPEAWKAIASRLDAEFDVQDSGIAQKLSDTALTPPPGSFDAIMTKMDAVSPAPSGKPARVVSMAYRRVAIVAAAVVLIALSAWYFMSSGSGTTPAAVPGIAVTDDNNIIPEASASVVPSPVTQERITQARVIRRSPRMIRQYADVPPGMITQAVYSPYENTGTDVPALQHAGIDDLTPVNTINRPNVPGPLIRDANGDVIIDRNLVVSPDNNYIIVTGPNGEQTRISAKFLDMLESMNAEEVPDGYFDMIFRENTLWKSRFRQWRNKLLQQSTFIPSATNFLDLLELRDMLED